MLPIIRVSLVVTFTYFSICPVLAQFPVKGKYNALLNGAIDIHVHTTPDAFDRSISDFELAELAQRRGLRAIVIKNHGSSTAARAELINSQFDNIRLYGGITLNKAVGGINPHAVEWMSRVSPDYGKFVWFPTFDAASHVQAFGNNSQGLTILNDGRLTTETLEVLAVIARQNLILCTGHLSYPEIKLLVEEATRRSITNIVITHALGDTPNLSIGHMRELANQGAFLELTYLSFLSGPQSHLGFLQSSKHVSIKEMVDAIKTIGAQHFIISTDLGQSGNPIPTDGLLTFVKFLMEGGVSETDIKIMLRKNPEKLLGL